MIPREIALNVANWHSELAIKHYLLGEFDLYARHIQIADRMRQRARWV
jgi:hypothetical protein